MTRYTAIWAPMLADGRRPDRPREVALAGLHRAVGPPGEPALRRPAAGLAGGPAPSRWRARAPGETLTLAAEWRVSAGARSSSPPRSSASCSTPSGSWSSPASGRAAGPTRCRSGTCRATARSGSAPTPSRRRSKNLERDPRATLLIETGHEYAELRGVEIEAEAEIHRDADAVVEFGQGADVRYSEGIDSVEGDAAAALEAQARSGSPSAFTPKRTATWDHRKLGGDLLSALRGGRASLRLAWRN